MRQHHRLQRRGPGRSGGDGHFTMFARAATDPYSRRGSGGGGTTATSKPHQAPQPAASPPPPPRHLHCSPLASAPLPPPPPAARGWPPWPLSGLWRRHEGEGTRRRAAGSLVAPSWGPKEVPDEAPINRRHLHGRNAESRVQMSGVVDDDSLFCLLWRALVAGSGRGSASFSSAIFCLRRRPPPEPRLAAPSVCASFPSSVTASSHASSSLHIRETWSGGSEGSSRCFCANPVGCADRWRWATTGAAARAACCLRRRTGRGSGQAWR